MSCFSYCQETPTNGDVAGDFCNDTLPYKNSVSATNCNPITTSNFPDDCNLRTSWDPNGHRN